MTAFSSFPVCTLKIIIHNRPVVHATLLELLGENTGAVTENTKRLTNASKADGLGLIIR
jgi:hypothetical protein